MTPWYVRAAVPGRDVILRGGTAALAAASFAFAGCGGGERQDANEKDGTYKVDIVDTSFPPRQQLAQGTEMVIVVRNVDEHTIPDLSVTVEAEGEGTEAVAFGTLSDEPALASRSRPVWVVEHGPHSGDTAYTNTWAIGPLEPGRDAEFRWRVAAVEPGSYRLTYRLAGSLGGKSRVELEDGGAAAGSFDVVVNRKPRQARIAADGTIVRVPPRAERPEPR